MHLVGVDCEKTQLAIHFGRLQCPSGPLLVKTHPEDAHWQQQHKHLSQLIQLIQKVPLETGIHVLIIFQKKSNVVRVKKN